MKNDHFKFSMRFYNAIVVILMVLSISPSFSETTVYAFPNSLNNNRVLEDSDFSADMPESEIQAFLNDKGSFFASYSDPAGNGTASHVFWQLAHDNGISPRVILVTAQKESSSISSYKDMNATQYDSKGSATAPNGTPYGTKADWFLFCGWTESTVMLQYKGFYNQVKCAAQTFGNVFKNSYAPNFLGGKRVGDSATLDQVTVTLENAATLSLYNYTPHIQTRFFDIWTSYLSNPHFTSGSGGSTCPTISNWKGEYYNNTSLSGNPVLCRDDASVDYDWGEGGPGGGVAVDSFSARWTRNWTFTAGRYRFHLVGDDGVRLWVDGNLVINQWKDQGATEYTYDMDLSGGSHSLKVEYYENGGGAAAKLWWDLIGITCPTISNWKGEYYNNTSLSGNPVLCRDDASVNFDWGGGGPGGGVAVDSFSARWTRNWTFTAGRYRFHLLGDDGVRLWVDGNLVINQWKDQGATEYTYDMDLSGGSHSLKVEYYENGGGAAAKLWWDNITPALPQKPTLSNPGNGASMAQSTDVTLSWNTASNATQYKVEVWGGQYSLMTPCDWQSGTSCHIGQMWPGTMSWHVKARNSVGQESDWSDTWVFTIQQALQLPSKPTLSNPGNGASMAQNTDVTLSWNTASNATQYKVEVWGGPYSLMTPCDWQSGTSCHIGQMWPGTMSWHVKARNSAGQESDWSDTWAFTIQQAPATWKPTLSSPSNGVQLPKSTDVTLIWNSLSGATQYKVELWGGPYSLMTPCNWQSGTSCHIGGMWPGNMMWHVKARDASGKESDWSDDWNFTILN